MEASSLNIVGNKAESIKKKTNEGAGLHRGGPLSAPHPAPGRDRIQSCGGQASGAPQSQKGVGTSPAAGGAGLGTRLACGGSRCVVPGLGAAPGRGCAGGHHREKGPEWPRALLPAIPRSLSRKLTRRERAGAVLAAEHPPRWSWNAEMPLARDLVHPSLEDEKKKHKKKRLVQSPNSYFMDVKCPGCYKITTVFSHAQTVVLCVGCSTVLCQPTGGKARLTEGCSFRRKQH
uniref:40S ribosomal protein S27 n=1 Tax=Sarcophilus harrisii TaxID=9305 RepID=A0A7N4P3A0_SARHA